MHALDIPELQNGFSGLSHGVPSRVFFPHDRQGREPAALPAGS
jgi:hypothetical protein